MHRRAPRSSRTGMSRLSSVSRWLGATCGATTGCVCLRVSVCLWPSACVACVCASVRLGGVHVRVSAWCLCLSLLSMRSGVNQQAPLWTFCTRLGEEWCDVNPHSPTVSGTAGRFMPTWSTLKMSARRSPRIGPTASAARCTISPPRCPLLCSVLSLSWGPPFAQAFSEHAEDALMASPWRC